MTVAERSPLLAEFLVNLREAFAAADLGPEAKAALARIYRDLDVPCPAGRIAPHRLPVCAHVGAALSIARRGSPILERLANTFAALEPSLSWRRRPTGGPHASENWPESHANAILVGPQGLEDRSDLLIGVSLLGPNVRYPDHNHEPEEVYLLLSPGRFQHGASGWLEPGTGGTLYNEPNIRHAMASDATPLLALWCLWVGAATE
jgi:hypothetical protein